MRCTNLLLLACCMSQISGFMHCHTSAMSFTREAPAFKARAYMLMPAVIMVKVFMSRRSTELTAGAAFRC